MKKVFTQTIKKIIVKEKILVNNLASYLTLSKRIQINNFSPFFKVQKVYFSKKIPKLNLNYTLDGDEYEDELDRKFSKKIPKLDLNFTLDGDEYKDKLDWEFSNKMTAYANELKNKEPVPYYIEENKPSSVKFIETDNDYIFSEEAKNKTIYVRKVHNQLFPLVYDELKSGRKHGVVIIGSPGIGKSRSLIYFASILLKNNELFAYHVQKDEKLYLFIPPQSEEGDYEVYFTIAQNYMGFAHQWNNNLYMLIDPGEKAQKDWPIPKLAKTIIMASPNSPYAGHLTGKKRNYFKCFLPVLKENEFMEIYRYEKYEKKKKTGNLNLESLEEITKEGERKFDIVGGKLRNVFDYSEGELEKKAQKSLEKLEYYELKKCFVLKDEMKDYASPLFSLYLLNDNYTEELDIQQFSDVTIDYASEYSKEIILKKFYKQIRDSFVKGFINESDRMTHGKLFEAIVISMMTTEHWTKIGYVNYLDKEDSDFSPFEFGIPSKKKPDYLPKLFKPTEKEFLNYLNEKKKKMDISNLHYYIPLQNQQSFDLLSVTYQNENDDENKKSYFLYSFYQMTIDSTKNLNPIWGFMEKFRKQIEEQDKVHFYIVYPKVSEKEFDEKFAKKIMEENEKTDRIYLLKIDFEYIKKEEKEKIKQMK